MDKVTAIKLGRQLGYYEDSEQADQKASEDILDVLWQCIYDVCKLVNAGIIEADKDEDYQEALTWLIASQKLTKNYQDFDLKKIK